MQENLESRLLLLRGLRSEVVGPDPVGISLETLPARLSNEELWKEFAAVRQGNGEEILTRDGPVRRYGAGVLYPRETLESPDADDADGLGAGPADADTARNARDDDVRAQAQARTRRFDAESDDFGLTATNGFKPSAMGLSFVVDLGALEAARQRLNIIVASRFRTGRDSFEQENCGFYRLHKVAMTDGSQAQAESRDRSWWLRAPFIAQHKEPTLSLGADDLDAGLGRHDVAGVEGFPGKISIRWHVRRWPEAAPQERLVTITLVNESRIGEGAVDSICLFQSGLVIEAPLGVIKNYPRTTLSDREAYDPLEDERVNRVIYRQRTVRSVGHGCAVDWLDTSDGTKLWTDVMPAWEMHPMDFDVIDREGRPLQLPMRLFSEMERSDSMALDLLERLVSGYEKWISDLKPDSVAELQETAVAIVQRCKKVADRMRDGLQLLRGRDANVLKAFALANRAMLMAQHRRSGEARLALYAKGQVSASGARLRGRSAASDPDPVGWSRAYEALDLESEDARAAEQRLDRPVGMWRPFQLAFLLMSLDGVVHDDSDDRQTVDLIWFPTGGGKTEAYLGLTAFTVFYNALSGRVSKAEGENRAVSIMMRYTLRLLTAQQFERAVKLFCAMELLRVDSQDALGDLPFTVGLWVGGSNTPNRIDNRSNEAPGAKQSLENLRRDPAARNPFVLLQCPWCCAPFGPDELGFVRGYRISGSGTAATFEYVCPDRSCEFGQGRGLRIPAQVVDENLYRSPPTLLIGTVDKFAMLAWMPETRAFFGIDADGARHAAGPSLIIQDEMHLMTGPLGTMVGLFETSIDALCRYKSGTSPKVIASTATAARAGEQILGLYSRKDSMVFPPPGLDASDAFFAREDSSKPGRLYVGVLAPGHGSMQTTQRIVYAALAQGAADLASSAYANTPGDRVAKTKEAAEVADPWWTLLAYYNSLRELGGALTLFGADIPDQLGVLRKRRATEPSKSRRVYVDGRVLELTSRLDSGEVPHALRSLEKGVHNFAADKDGGFSVWAESGPQDACLASNIVEVGVDVPRLSLMAIVGQPKTTASYIQASSRVGRREDRPGLVVMLYSSTKPRDRSHYERFRAYHQAIYAWVEPTSVTPFSPPVLERALHAVMVSMLRQRVPANFGPQQVIEMDEALAWVEIELRKRAESVARDDEVTALVEKLRRLVREWRAYNPHEWGKIVISGALGDSPMLMFPTGREKPESWRLAGWATPTSLRAVDATCDAEVSSWYAEQLALTDDSLEAH
ncbi:helicase-related protein [Luteimonas pelagia]